MVLEFITVVAGLAKNHGVATASLVVALINLIVCWKLFSLFKSQKVTHTEHRDEVLESHEDLAKANVETIDNVIASIRRANS